MKTENALMIFGMALITLILFSCNTYSSGGSGSSTANSSANIQITGFAFSPSTYTAAVGQSITWQNNDSTAHTVTSTSGSELNSENINQGGTYSHIFATAGTYNYICSIHTYMHGSIVVTN